MEELWLKVKIFLVNFASFEKRSRGLRYLLPLTLILIILLFINVLPDKFFQIIHSQTAVFLILLSIVTLSAWFGGFGPGIVATFLTATLEYFMLLKKDILYYSETADAVVVTVYLAISLIISIISEARYESEIQRDEFLRSAAHELKNPLTSIKAFAQLIADEAKKDNLLKLRNYAENIQNQSERLIEIINDLLDVTRIEIGKFSYKEEPFNFDDLVKEIVAHQKITNKDRKIILSGQTKKVIMGDRYRIGQVVTNLLTNAIKYSPKDSPVEVTIKTQQSSMVLRVKDYGVGIPKEDRDKIFFRLYRTKKAERTGPEGLGLGLYISSQIVRHHRGQIWVKSKEGHCSIFFLQLPHGKKVNYRNQAEE